MSVVMPEDDFFEKFRPVTLPDDSLLRELDAVRGSDPNHVWTVVETDEDDILYAVPGIHFVNEIGYLLTEQPWTDSEMTAVYSSGPDPD